MQHLQRIFLLALVALALPAAAQADSVLAPATGAVNLAAGGGYHAWLERAPVRGQQLVVRAPDGTVTRPDVATFSSPSQLSIGSAGSTDPSNRQLSVVYSRNGDIYRYDLRAQREVKVSAISSRYRETGATVQYGAYVFVRATGPRPGIYYRRPGRSARRITSHEPLLFESNGTRVAYNVERRVIVRRLSGEGSVITFRSPTRVQDVTLTRYRVAWLAGAGRVFQSARFGGSGAADTTVANQAERKLPDETQSIATDGSRVAFYVDAQSVKRISPPLFEG